MGGFHGGHSSGGHSSGGFHGGSHSSYHSSYHSSSHSSYTSYSSRPMVVHTVRNGRHYLDGKRYYGAYYGLQGGKPRSFATFFAMGFFSLLFGFLMFLIFFRVGTQATVTYAWRATDSHGIPYEEYDFEYEFYGQTFKGYGDDDLSFNGIDSKGEFTVKVGQTYELYVSPFNPASYSFTNTSVVGVVFFAIAGTLGAFIMTRAILIKRKHDKELAEVGDINGDGVINDADLAYADALRNGKNEGAFEGSYQASKENEYLRQKVYRRCPYCDSIVDDDAKFCAQCGSNLK